METDTVFKVILVKRDGNDILRLSIAVYNTPLVITYPPGEWVSANPTLLQSNHGICVFTEYEHARGFYSASKSNGDYLGSEIWEAEAQESMELPSFYNIHMLADLPSVPVVPLGMVMAGHGESYHWPQGTAMYKRIRLLKCITPPGGIQ